MPSDQFHRVEKLTGECEQWIAPTLENSWANAGGGTEEAGYYKDKFNHVSLKGRVDTGANNTVIFTLPAGYRPSATITFPVTDSTNGVSRIYILTDGTITIVGYTGTWASLDGVSFRV